MQRKIINRWCLISLLVMCIQSIVVAQQNFSSSQMDSLYGLIHNSEINDTTRANAFYDYRLALYHKEFYDSSLVVAEQYLEFSLKKGLKQHAAKAEASIGYTYFNNGETPVALSHFEKGLELAIEIDDKKLQFEFYRDLGAFYGSRGECSKSLEYTRKSLEVAQELDFQEGIARAFTNIAHCLVSQGILVEAIKNYSSALSTFEKLQTDKTGLGDVLNSIAHVNYIQGDYNEALKYLERSLTVYDSIKHLPGIASSLKQIGICHMENGNLKSALEYSFKSLEMSQKMGNKMQVAGTFNNIGTIYDKQGKQGLALKKYTKAAMIHKEIGDLKGYSIAYRNVGNMHYKMEDFQTAIEHYKVAYEINYKQGNVQQLGEIANSLYTAYKHTGQFEKALEMHEIYITSRDSIISIKNKEEIMRQDLQYEYEKKTLADSLKSIEANKITEAKLLAQEAQLEQEATQRYALFGGIGLLALFGGVMYNRFRLTSRQKNVIELQKETVEKQKAIVEEAHEELAERNKEITDSIAYAKRIQSAILPPQKLVKEHLQNSFILYKPKDVVAGDFYWMETIGNVVYYAAADCTGHGVPGAMVSVICVNGLNRAVREFGLTDPAKILDKTRDLVIKEFEKSEDDVKDGMDISLCALNTLTNEMYWAGAHNPLWIVRSESDEIEEFKADKQPIGKFELTKPFTSHQIQLQEGDTIYIFSDGFPDQFGGENGKKYKSGKFKRTLINLAKQDIDTQLRILDNEFEQWKGDLEQLDDVCVIGVKV